MPGAIHFVELLDKLKDPSHLIIPPLNWNKVQVTSALHLCSILRAAGKEAYILAQHSWKTHLEDQWPQDFFILDENENYTIAKRPDWVWLWGLGQSKEHSPALKEFLLGCDTIQVVDWTQERHRRWGDYIYQTPLLGGLSELAFKLTIEAQMQQKAESSWLSQAMDSFLNQYSFAIQDSPLIHMLGQLDSPPRVISVPEIEPASVLEKQPWKIIAYAELNEVSVELLRQNALDIYARAGAEHILFVYETTPGDVFMNIVTSDARLEFQLRKNLKDELPLNIDGSFKINELEQLLNLLPINKEDVENVKPCAWPKSNYAGTAYNFECPDPVWELEKERRLEMQRVAEDESDEEEEEEEEDLTPTIDWDSSDLLQRIQSLNNEQESKKPPRIILSYRDLKETYEIYDRARERSWETSEEEVNKAYNCENTLEQIFLKKSEDAKKRIELEEQWREKIKEELEAYNLRKEEERKQAEEADAKRLEEEAKAQRLAEEAEAKRLEEETEAKRLAELEEEQRLAEEAEAKKLEKVLEEEEQKAFEEQHELSEEDRQAQLEELEALREKEEDEEALREFFSIEEGTKDDSDADILHRNDSNWNSEALDATSGQDAMLQEGLNEDSKEGIEYPTYEEFLEAVGPIDPDEEEEEKEEGTDLQEFVNEKVESDEVLDELDKIEKEEAITAEETAETKEQVSEVAAATEETAVIQEQASEEAAATEETAVIQEQASEEAAATEETAVIQEQASEEAAATEETAVIQEQASEEAAATEETAEIQEKASEEATATEETAQIQEQTSEEAVATEETAVIQEQASEEAAATEETAQIQEQASEEAAATEETAQIQEQASEEATATEETAQIQEQASEEATATEETAQIQEQASEEAAATEETAQIQEQASEEAAATEETAQIQEQASEEATATEETAQIQEQASEEATATEETAQIQEQASEEATATEETAEIQEQTTNPYTNSESEHDGSADDDYFFGENFHNETTPIVENLDSQSKRENQFIFDGRNVELDIFAKLRQSSRLRKADFIYLLGFILLSIYLILNYYSNL